MLMTSDGPFAETNAVGSQTAATVKSSTSLQYALRHQISSNRCQLATPSTIVRWRETLMDQTSAATVAVTWMNLLPDDKPPRRWLLENQL